MNESSMMTAALVTTLALASQLAFGQTPPDNTRANKVESNHTQRTAEGQSNERNDLELTRQIRRSIVDDGSLSTYAHNVKIITIGGKVTLNGVVRSEQEKAAVVAKAMEVAGQGKVTDELKIAPAK